MIDSFRVRGIPSELVEKFWPFAEPYIKRALDRTSGEFTPAHIKMLCKDRVVQLWLVNEGERIVGAVTTEIVVYPNRKHCRVLTIAGPKASEWTAEIDAVLSVWAKAQGCSAVEAFIRKGYVPAWAKHGYSHKYSAVFKELP